MNNAGFWLRVVASIIDFFIIFLFFLVCKALLSGFIIGLLTFFVPWLYFTVMESSEYQATLGKRMLRLSVTDLRGKRISFARANGRYFAKILSGAIFGIGYLMVAFTQNKQGLHDILAGCLVEYG